MTAYKEIFKYLFRKDSPPHQSTCCVQSSWNLANGKLTKLCVIYLTKKKNKISPHSPALDSAWIEPKICQGQPYTMYYEWIECSRFHPNRFTFGRVISECVNTIRARSKVNAVFGWSLASSRIKIKSHHINSHNKSYSYLCCNHRYESRNSWAVIFNHCSTKKDSAASIIIITLELQHRKSLAYRKDYIMSVCVKCTLEKLNRWPDMQWSTGWFQFQFVLLLLKWQPIITNKRPSLPKQLECGPMPNVMVALPNIGGELCSTPQSLADAHY